MPLSVGALCLVYTMSSDESSSSHSESTYASSTSLDISTSTSYSTSSSSLEDIPTVIHQASVDSEWLEDVFSSSVDREVNPRGSDASSESSVLDLGVLLSLPGRETAIVNEEVAGVVEGMVEGVVEGMVEVEGQSTDREKRLVTYYDEALTIKTFSIDRILVPLIEQVSLLNVFIYFVIYTEVYIGTTTSHTYPPPGLEPTAQQ